MILSSSQFVGQINITGIHDSGGATEAKIDDLNTFISVYEPIYINKILGEKLAIEFNTFLSNPTEEERWVKLKAILSQDGSALARYVYFFYVRTKTYQISSTGTFSEGISPRNICTQTWNDNIKFNEIVYKLISNGDYEGFLFDDELLRAIW